jgi:hypothetical protein
VVTDDRRVRTPRRQDFTRHTEGSPFPVHVGGGGDFGISILDFGMRDADWAQNGIASVDSSLRSPGCCALCARAVYPTGVRALIWGVFEALS